MQAWELADRAAWPGGHRRSSDPPARLLGHHHTRPAQEAGPHAPAPTCPTPRSPIRSRLRALRVSPPVIAPAWSVRWRRRHLTSSGCRPGPPARARAAPSVNCGRHPKPARAVSAEPMADPLSRTSSPAHFSSVSQVVRAASWDPLPGERCLPGQHDRQQDKRGSYLGWTCHIVLSFVRFRGSYGRSRSTLEPFGGGRDPQRRTADCSGKGLLPASVGNDEVGSEGLSLSRIEPLGGDADSAPDRHDRDRTRRQSRDFIATAGTSLRAESVGPSRAHSSASPRSFGKDPADPSRGRLRSGHD